VETHRDHRILLKTTLASYIVEVPTFQKRLGLKEYVMWKSTSKPAFFSICICGWSIALLLLKFSRKSKTYLERGSHSKLKINHKK